MRTYQKTICIAIALLIFPIFKSIGQIKGGVLKSSVENKNLTISLKVYYDCGFQNIPTSEYAALFDTLALGSMEYVELKEVSSNEVYSNISAPCKGLNSCFIEVTYVGKVEKINAIPHGYYLGWNHCCINSEINNFNLPPNTTISLSNYISNDVLTKGNNAPSILQSPFLIGCSNYENSLFFNVVDTLDGDEISINNGVVNTGISKVDEINNQRKAPNGNVGISSPPYLKMEYKDSFLLSQPFGKQAIYSITDSTKTIFLNKAQSGNYITRIDVIENVRNMNVNSMQVFAITQIK